MFLSVFGKYAPALDENKGTSVVLASTQKGKSAIEFIGDRLMIREMSLGQVHGGNVCLAQSAPAGVNREKFLTSLDKLGFRKAMRRDGKASIKVRLQGFFAEPSGR